MISKHYLRVDNRVIDEAVFSDQSPEKADALEFYKTHQPELDALLENPAGAKDFMKQHGITLEQWKQGYGSAFLDVTSDHIADCIPHNIQGVPDVEKKAFMNDFIGSQKRASAAFSAMTDAVNNGTLVNPTKPSFADGPANETRIIAWPDTSNAELVRMGILTGANLYNHASGELRTRILHAHISTGEHASEKWTMDFDPNENRVPLDDIRGNKSKYLSFQLPQEASQMVQAAKNNFQANNAQMANSSESALLANKLPMPLAVAVSANQTELS